jgi:6-pyruvoyltetrahydropterin/6-carboxytetrahydropterin synthase
VGKVVISKEYRWEMGHRLPWHKGGCQNVHGHSYVLLVELTGEVSDEGMVLDYKDISTHVKPLLNELDHSYMIDPSDQELRATLTQLGLKMTEVPFWSTAENIVLWIGERLKEHLLTGGIESMKLTVKETASTTASAEWRRD